MLPSPELDEGSDGPIFNTCNLQPPLISRPGLRTLRGWENDAWAAATRAA